MDPLNTAVVFETGEKGEEFRGALAGMAVRFVLNESGITDLQRLASRLQNAHADVVMIQVEPIATRLDEVFNALKQGPAPPVIVAVQGSADPDLIVAAMHAGASEVVFPPFIDRLLPAFERAAKLVRQTALTTGRARTVGFLSVKGGCGATTIAAHVAMEIQRTTQDRILLADMDLQAGLIRFLLKAKSEYSILDAARNLHRLDASFWRGIVSNGIPRLEVISAPAGTLRTEPADVHALRQVLSFTRGHYEWVIADLGRGVNSSVGEALEDIDEAYIVTTLDVLALYQAKQVVQTLISAGYGHSRIRAVVNRISKRAEITAAEIEKTIGVPVYFALPEDNSALFDAYAAGGLLDGRSSLGAQFGALARKIAGVAEPKKPKSKFSLFG